MKETIKKELNINEIIKLDKEEAFTIVKDYYENMVYKIASDIVMTYPYFRSIKDDLIQEGFIGLYDALNKFDMSFNNKFITFAYTIVKRRMLSYIRKYQKIYSSELYFDDLAAQETLGYYKTNFYNINSKTLYYGQYDNEQILKAYNKLSDFEKTIIKYKIKGYSYIEIGKKMNITRKQVDYQLQKINHKLSDYILDN